MLPCNSVCLWIYTTISQGFVKVAHLELHLSQPVLWLGSFIGVHHGEYLNQQCKTLINSSLLEVRYFHTWSQNSV